MASHRGRLEYGSPGCEQALSHRLKSRANSCPSPILGAMPDLPVFAACSRLDDVVDDACTRHEPVFLTRRGRRVAAVIDAEDPSVSPRRRRTWRTLRLPTTPVPRSPSAASSHVQDQVQPRTCRVHWSHADVELLAQNPSPTIVKKPAGRHSAWCGHGSKYDACRSSLPSTLSAAPLTRS